MNRNTGITLIALVVTIIILIILAGISVNLLLSEGGILQRAKEQKKEQRKVRILEELELAKGPITIEGEGYTSLEKYLEAIKDKKIANMFEVTSVEQLDEANGIIWVDRKYKYTVAQIGIDVIINAEGMVGELEPEIKIFQIVEKTSTDIVVEVKAILAEEYEFYIKEENEEEYQNIGKIESEKKETNEIETIQYTYKDIELAEEKNYILKVVAKNKVRDCEKTTTLIPAPTITVIEEETWSNESKEVIIEERDGYRIKYTIDGSEPSKTNGEIYTGQFIVDKNCTIKAVYIDSKEKIGNMAVKGITKIDKKEPSAIITSADGFGTNSTCSFIAKLQIELIDDESKINTENSKYIWSESATEIGKTSNLWNDAMQIGETSKMVNKTIETTGSWYLHILATDNAGNKKEIVSKEIKVEMIEEHIHTESCYSTGMCSTARILQVDSTPLCSCICIQSNATYVMVPRNSSDKVVGNIVPCYYHHTYKNLICSTSNTYGMSYN